MKRWILMTAWLVALGPATPGGAEEPAAKAPLTTAEVLAASQPSDWRPLAPENTLYVELPAGRVVIELAPAFAPLHVANVVTLAGERYFDGIPIVRSQDNYVVQWADPDGESPEKAKPLGSAKPRLQAELDRPAAGLPFTALPDGDVYAPEVGLSDGFPVGRDPARGRAWLTHCYGMVGAGRGEAADSGNGAELYVVVGHAPRHLDRNVTLLGRVVRGVELLSTLPRGTGPLGFYEEVAERLPLAGVRLASTVPASERTELEVLRTDTATFTAYVESRRFRRESWFLDPAGHVELCNVAIPARERKSAPENG